MALDLSVQHPWGCSGNYNYAYLLATERKDLRKLFHLCAIAKTGRLVGGHSVSSSLYATGVCPSRSWQHSILVEQRSHRLYVDSLRLVLDWIFAWITWLSFGNFHRLRAIFPFTIALARPVGPAIMYVAPCKWLCISADMNQSLILLTGFPYFVVVINLPQRFQVVNGDSPIMAGVHLLPLLSAMAFGEMVSAL